MCFGRVKRTLVAGPFAPPPFSHVATRHFFTFISAAVCIREGVKGAAARYQVHVLRQYWDFILLWAALLWMACCWVIVIM